MLVTFRSTATQSITMFHDQAVDLLKLMGATGRIPGALSPGDVPSALRQLEGAVENLKAATHAATPARPADNEDTAADEKDDEDNEPPVALAVRAVPLLSLLKRAAAANAEVMWEGK